MPDPGVGIHHDLHAAKPGAGAEIHVFEVEEEFLVQSAELTVGFGAHEPEHARDPVGAGDAVGVWQVGCEGVSG